MNKIKTFTNVIFLTMTMLFFICFNATGQDLITGNSPVLERIISSGVIKVGVNPNFKPFSYTENGKRLGVSIEMAKLLGNMLGVKTQIEVPNSFNELIPMLHTGAIDIIMADMTKNFSRAMVINFSNSYFQTGLTIMLNKVQAGKDKIPVVNEYGKFIEGLKKDSKEQKLCIAVTKGKSPAKSAPIFFPNSKITYYPTNEKSAEAVLSGKAHIMIHDETFLKIWFNDNKKRSLYKLVVFPKPFKKDNYAFAIQKGNQEFLNLINVFVMELKVEGYFKRFMKKYNLDMD